MSEKYYNVKEALDYIRNYPSGKIDKEFYMDITEKQIRDILKKDVLGRYLQFSEGERRTNTKLSKEKKLLMIYMYFQNVGKIPKFSRVGIVSIKKKIS